MTHTHSFSPHRSNTAQTLNLTLPIRLPASRPCLPFEDPLPPHPSPCERAYVGHASHIMGIRFSPDNQYVVSVGGYDRGAMQWRVLATAHDDVVVERPDFGFKVYQAPKKQVMELDAGGVSPIPDVDSYCTTPMYCPEVVIPLRPLQSLPTPNPVVRSPCNPALRPLPSWWPLRSRCWHRGRTPTLRPPRMQGARPSWRRRGGPTCASTRSPQRHQT